MSATLDAKNSQANSNYTALTQQIDEMMGRIFVDLGFIRMIFQSGSELGRSQEYNRMNKDKS